MNMKKHYGSHPIPSPMITHHSHHCPSPIQQTLVCRDDIRKMASEVLKSTRTTSTTTTIAAQEEHEDAVRGVEEGTAAAIATADAVGPMARAMAATSPASRSSRAPIDPATEQFLSALNVLIVDGTYPSIHTSIYPSIHLYLHHIPYAYYASI